MVDQPSLIFVPGAWHTPDCYTTVIEHLRKTNPVYNCISVTLPSTIYEGIHSELSMQPDVDAIKTAIHKEINNGRILVVIAHSYGSLVASEALAGIDPSRATLLIISGFLLDSGNSLLSSRNGAKSALWNVQGELVKANDPEHHFYHDVEEAERQKLVERASRAVIPYACFTTKMTYAAWKDFQTVYVICEDDHTIIPESQELMISLAREKGARIEVERLHSSHSPFLSVPQETAELIRRAAEQKSAG